MVLSDAWPEPVRRTTMQQPLFLDILDLTNAVNFVGRILVSQILLHDVSAAKLVALDTTLDIEHSAVIKARWKSTAVETHIA